MKLWVSEGFMGILLAIEASFSPTRMPMIVTVNAAILIHIGVVVVGALSSKMFITMNTPATMLPVARRVIGFMTIGMFSCKVEVDDCWGCPVCISRTIRSV